MFFLSPPPPPLTADMRHWLGNMLILTLWLECKGEDRVTQSTGDVIATEGQTVTLDCSFEINVNVNEYLFWYKQEVNDFPKYMLKSFSNEVFKAPEFQEDRFDATINKTSVPLKIQKLLLSDSAVYYCALRHLGGTKLLFGSGTTLFVQTKDDHPPSFYKLSAGNISACLATDFSRNKAAETKYTFFNKTKAVLVKGDSLYNQVALLSPEEEEICDEDGSDECEESLQPDPKVNLMSLTILVLRLLFFKTVVFNVLMTLRLWISQ